MFQTACLIYLEFRVGGVDLYEELVRGFSDICSYSGADEYSNLQGFRIVPVGTKVPTVLEFAFILLQCSPFSTTLKMDCPEDGSSRPLRNLCTFVIM
jgi:hypothetical protein